MGTPYLGFGATLGFGEESTWGTAVSRTNWLRVVSTDLKRTIEKVPRPHLGTKGATSMNRRQFFIASDKFGGNFETELAYDDSTLLLLKHLFGAVNTSGGAAPYTHAFTLANALPTGLTIEQILGTGSAIVGEGCLITSATISGNVGETCRGRWTVIGETSGGRTSAGTPTYSSNGNPLLHHQAGSFTGNGSSPLNDKILSFELTIDNKLAERQLLGSKLTARPSRGDFMEVTMRVTREYDVDTIHGDFVADTQRDYTLTFTGSGDNSFSIELHNALVMDVQTAVSSPGILQETFELKAFSDGTDEGVELTITNANDAATTN